MEGDKGVGLTGELADKARNIGSDPNAWIQPVEAICAGQ